jgi:FKBP-type peptidyl-prolyl cis-trans isomerase (trigger factor)
MESKKYTIIKSIENPHSELSVEVEISEGAIAEYRAKALTAMTKEAELPGFRKGKVPESVVLKKVSEMHLLEEAAQLALDAFIPEIVKEKKLLVITSPNVSITKIAPGNPMTCTILFTLLPEIKLPDYKAIAKKHNKKEDAVEITDKEIEKAIEDIQNRFASHEGEKTDSKEKNLPELNDEFVKKLGEFKDVADFKLKLKDGLKQEKERANKEKKRLAIMEDLAEKTKIDLPKILVEQELAKMEGQFSEDIGRMGVKVEDYLKHIKKTIDDIRKEWAPDAEKRAALELILPKIAAEEKLKIDAADLDHEVKHLLEHYKDADPQRAALYMESVLTKEKVFEFLENPTEEK